MLRSHQLPCLMTGWEERGGRERPRRSMAGRCLHPKSDLLAWTSHGFVFILEAKRRQAEVFIYFDDMLQSFPSLDQNQVMPQEQYFSSLKSSKQFDSKEKCSHSSSSGAPCFQSFQCRTVQWTAQLYTVIWKTRFLRGCSCFIWPHRSGSGKWTHHKELARRATLAWAHPLRRRPFRMEGKHLLNEAQEPGRRLSSCGTWCHTSCAFSPHPMNKTLVLEAQDFSYFIKWIPNYFHWYKYFFWRHSLPHSLSSTGVLKLPFQSVLDPYTVAQFNPCDPGRLLTFPHSTPLLLFLHLYLTGGSWRDALRARKEQTYSTILQVLISPIF